MHWSVAYLIGYICNEGIFICWFEEVERQDSWRQQFFLDDCTFAYTLFSKDSFLSWLIWVGIEVKGLGISDIVRQLNIVESERSWWTIFKRFRILTSFDIYRIVLKVDKHLVVIEQLAVLWWLENSTSFDRAQSWINQEFWREHKSKVAIWLKWNVTGEG